MKNAKADRMVVEGLISAPNKNRSSASLAGKPICALSFTVPGEPIPLQRARVVRNRHGGGIHAFTPDKCVSHCDKVRLYATRALPENFTRFTGPLDVYVDFFRQRPKSLSKKKRWPVSRPDLSNYLKLIEDALNGLLWEDDSQIVSCVLCKVYAEADQEPRTEVHIIQLGEGLTPWD
jgi:Holliday junction resolvase RusA-like endonuclease